MRFRRDRVLLLMTLPAVLLVLLFNYVPILGNIVAFQEYDPYISDNGVVSILHSPWVGLENFQRIFEDSAFWNAVRNTLVLFFLQLILYFPSPSCSRCSSTAWSGPGCGRSRRPSSTCRTSSPGCWSSPSSSSCSAAPDCSPRSCASTDTTGSV
ncbi:hypothetical protein SHKM778_21420 [Streptomyces sp. KM77-8]|uniref:Sugar ABC transporter permease n=1 Tax=Streptomyces haneummycinicus TaxID=3074435 RepID=A0AAT9HEA0_9ACTN